MFLTIIAPIAIGFIIILILHSNVYRISDAIFGIYRQSSNFYYLKIAFMFVMTRLRKPQVKSDDELDKPQPLSKNPLAIDAVYFNGVSENGNILAFGTAQRKNNRVDGFCILRVPEFSSNALVTPKFPDTVLWQTDIEELEDENGECYDVEGIKLKPLIPMESWKLNYRGKMKFENGSSELLDVEIDATWSSHLPVFNFDTDVHPLAIARAVGMESWSREYFHRLEYYHQTHYEQYGDVRGTVCINGKKYDIFTNSVRDHSFSEMRDWRNFHRYVMHFFTLKNGDRISVGVISMPINFSSLKVGFITSAKDKKNYPISCCDLELWQHGENGEPPKDYAFTFWANSRRYVVQVKVNKHMEFYIGEQAESRIVENYSDFIVNGVAGWGVAEWQYRNIKGLPKV